MAKKDDSFEVRERRRFTGDAATESSPADTASEADTPPQAADTGATPAPAESGTVPPDAGPTAESETPEAAVGAPEDEPSEAEGLEAGDDANVPMPEISAAAFLQFVLASLHEMAWQNMGLLPNPASGKVETKLKDARLTIDAFGALLSVLSPQLDERARREMQTTLSNLRLNFVEQSKRNEAA